MKRNKIYILLIPEGEREQETEHILRSIMAENLSNLGRETDLQTRMPEGPQTSLHLDVL